MIPQLLMDWLRDVIAQWLSGLNDLLSGFASAAAGSGLGGAMTQAGHVLALFISPGVWGAVFAAWGTWLGVWSVTGLIAIIARRGTAS